MTERFPQVFQASELAHWLALEQLERSVLNKATPTAKQDCHSGYLVADENGGALAGLFYGYARLDSLDAHSPFCWKLWSVAVRASHQRQGLGALLVQTALKAHTALHPSEPLAVVSRWQSKGFYTKMGFESVGYPLYRGPEHWSIAMVATPRHVDASR